MNARKIPITTPATEFQTERNFFKGIGLSVDQIADDAAKELPEKLNRVFTAHRKCNAVALKLACEDLSKFLGGMQAVTNSVVTATVGHINRRPRP